MQVVAFAGEERGHERLHPVAVVQSLRRDGTVGIAGVNHTVGELARGFVADVSRHLFDGRRDIGQPARQRTGRDVDRQLGGRIQRRQHRLHALEAVDHLLDGTGEVVFQVAQAHVYVAIALRLHLDEVLEVERLVLVAVAHQDVEVGVDDGGLVAPGHLERQRPDAVGLVGLGFLVRVSGRVYDVQLHPAAGGDFVLLQHVADTGHQRRQQRMGLFAEVAAQQQRLLQIAQQIAGGRREAVFPLGCEIEPQPAQRVEPDVEQEQVGHHQQCGEGHRDTVRPRALARAPALAVQREHVEHQKDAGQREVVEQVAQVYHTSLDGFEAAAGADGPQNLAEAVAHEVGQAAGAEQVKEAAD